MTVCKYCNKDDLDYDDLTKMYYCHYCNRLLDTDEVIENEPQEEIEETPIQPEQKKSRKKSEEEEYDYNTKEYQEEALNGFSLFILNFVMLIPIVNILVLFAILNSNVESQYRRVFSYRFVAGMVAVILIAVLFMQTAILERYDLINVSHQFIDKAVATLANTWHGDKSVPNLKVLDLMTIIESKHPEKTDNAGNDNTDFILTWSDLDKTVWTGSMLLDLFDKAGDDYIILIQTDGIRQKYGSKVYRNVGYRCIGSKIDAEDNNYFYDGLLTTEFEFYINDYGSTVDFGIEDLKNSKYIFYLNPTKSYTLHILKDEHNMLIGFALEEEVKESTSKKK